MSIEPGHRKRIHHIHDAAHCRELTFSCYQRLPLLVEDRPPALLSESIARACEIHRYRLVAFVFMPEHVHLLVYPDGGESRIDQLLRAIKRPMSYRVKLDWAASKNPMLSRLTIRQRPGVSTFRFWQEGPGYDRNLTNVEAVLGSMDYFHMNPVKRGLCSRAIDWDWSSARHYAGLASEVVIPPIYPLPAEFLA
jgi:putative transposase